MATIRHALTGLATLTLLVLNLILWGTIFFFVALPKLFVFWVPPLRRRVVVALAAVGDGWTAMNKGITTAMLSTKFEVNGLGDLDRSRHYLIVANHQSWVDVLVLFRIFHRKSSFIRFFMKSELIWFPIVGPACWALEFPFMKRYSAEYLEQHPERRGTDLATTRRACRRYAKIPVAIANFLEGTRFTREKHENQNSPYRHLLRPRIGGIAWVLASIGDRIDQVIDVTIAYPGCTISVWKFASNQVPRVVAEARTLDVPAEFMADEVTKPGPVRDRFAEWLDERWREKDARLEELC